MQRLTELNEQRRDVRVRVEKLKRIRAVVVPLETEDGGAGVQENLATRNGPLEQELEKMRFLLARVAGRVGQLPDPDDPAEAVVEEEGKARKRRVDEFLADPAVFPR